MKEKYEQIMALMKDCGDIMVHADRSAIGIDAKEGHGNFVTKYDKLIQDKLQEGLKKIMPEAAFIGEEKEKNDFPETGYAFVVDPIDGTTNFIKDLHFSCIAVCLVKDLKRIAGFVYNPYADEMFSAVRGEGACLNGKPIHVSKLSLTDALVLVGTSAYYEEYARLSMEKALEYLGKAMDIRRGGSAELDLCTVACGRAEMYFEPYIHPWDFGAGSIIVEEAGGCVTRMDGTDLDIRQSSSCFARGIGITQKTV